MATALKSLEQRFWPKVDRRGPDECWPWKGSTNLRGYGRLKRGGRFVAAHRLSWEIHYRKPVPHGLFVCHGCDNPPCVNPEHLWLGTHTDNMADMRRKGRAPHVKLTREGAEAIRRDDRSTTILAAIYGVTAQAIRDVRNRRTWRHAA